MQDERERTVGRCAKHASALRQVYSPEALILSPRTLFADMAHDLWRSRELAWRLAIRDVRSQYRGSLLGYFWAFITPLFSTAVWVFLSATGVVKVASTDIPYPAYVFSGTMLWQIFTEALSPLSHLGDRAAACWPSSISRGRH